ncbi:MAG: SAM-dependent methyltransferase [Bryobacteraceae bacterium]|jgi:SAM-dependent MidA family methyltransferase
MTAAAQLLAAEIARDGPIAFRRFMEMALYHPQHGYYRRRNDPFGIGGDFFTAEQLQPVFGLLMAARIRKLANAMGNPADFTVVELGAGRREMARAFSEWRYVPVDIDAGELPRRFRGVVFANEFFDALPVDAAIVREGKFLEQRVGFRDGRFYWETGGPVPAQIEQYLLRFTALPAAESDDDDDEDAEQSREGNLVEAGTEALAWMERIAGALEEGYLFAIDYGYTRAETVRFPRGTLMSYRRHVAREDVLENPGEQDITAHVNFTALEEHGRQCGLRRESLQTLTRTLLEAGEPDQFASVLSAAGTGEALRRRLQLKTLLAGMGETFRVLLARRGGGKAG